MGDTYGHPTRQSRLNEPRLGLVRKTHLSYCCGVPLNQVGANNPRWSPNCSANAEKGSYQLTQAGEVLFMGEICFPKSSLRNVLKTCLEIPGENPLSIGLWSDFLSPFSSFCCESLPVSPQFSGMEAIDCDIYLHLGFPSIPPFSLHVLSPPAFSIYTANFLKQSLSSILSLLCLKPRCPINARSVGTTIIDLIIIIGPCY